MAMQPRQSVLVLFLGSCSMLTGCSSELVTDRRPPVNPAPRDVRDEIRDARLFLALPDDTVGPAINGLPRVGDRPIGN